MSCKHFIKKLFIIIIVIVVLLISFYFVFVIVMMYSIKPSHETIIKEFQSNETTFNNIVGELSKLKGDIIIYPEDYDTKINNKELLVNLDLIFNKYKYQVIIKKKETISFQRWCALADRSSGIVYSTNTPPTIEFLTFYENISQSNWFYYETDFNK